MEYLNQAVDKGNKQGLESAAHIFSRNENGIKADGYKVLEFYEKLVALDDKRTSFKIIKNTLSFIKNV